MGSRIEGGNLPPITRGQKRRRNGNQKYPWQEWFDGELWRLTRGQDFDVKVESFRTAALGAAKVYGVTLGTRRVNDTTILLKVTDFSRTDRPARQAPTEEAPVQEAPKVERKRRFSFFR